jgi:levanase/fructan beta-fructosidase
MLLAQQPDWYSTYWPHHEGINYDEPYRGQFHFSPVSGWMNDINMLVYFNGIYHMTYQADHENVKGDEVEMLCQAYATSPDLIHWTDRGYALIPNSGVSGNIDAEHIFSGSGVVVSDSMALRITGSSDSAMIAIFTGVGRGTCLAWSINGGKTWNEYEGNPVANPTDSEDPRDPCVIWHEPEQKWVMAIFEDGTTFYESKNLIDWSYLSNLDFGHECPDFFELPLDGDPTNKKWVLQDALGAYLVGEFDGTTFLPEEGPYVMDQGPDFYAAQSFFRNTMPDEKLIQIAWLDTWNKSINTATWEHEATIPVELDLITYKGKMLLKRTPVPALSKNYEETVSWEELSIVPGVNIFEDIYSKKMDIIAEFDFTDATASEIQFQIANKTISYHIDSEKLTTSPEHIDYQEMLAEGPRSDTLGRLSNNRLKLRILADWGQLEIFGNDGVFSYSEQFAFSPCDSTLALTTVGGNVKLVSMEFHEVGRIWNGSPQARVTYEAMINTVGNGSVITDADCDRYPDGTVLTISAVPDAGYHFDGWEGDATGTTNPLEVIMNENKSITASFRINKFPSNPKIMPLGASRVEGNRPDYESFRYELWKNILDNGWSFDYIGTMTDPASYANYSGKVFDRHHEGHGGYTSGQILSDINGWISNAGIPDIVLFSSPGGNDALEELPVDDAISNINGIIDAVQASNPDVTIFIEQPVPAHSDMMTTELTVYIGKLQSEVLTLATQQTTTTSNVVAIDMFTGWSDAYLADDVHYNTTGAKVVANRYDAAMEAFYPGGAIFQYTLTTSATSGGTVTAGGTYDEGTIVTITATPDAGYQFDGWSGDAGASGSNPLSVTMDSDKSITANFSVSTETWRKVDSHDPSVTLSGTGYDSYTDAPFAYMNTWYPIWDGSASFTFTGTRVRYYAVTSKWNGDASIIIDGTTVGRASTYSSGDETGDVLVWESGTLLKGSHTIEVISVDEIGVDAFEYIPDSATSVVTNNNKPTNFLLYPNPANTTLFIDYDKTIESFAVYSSTGSLLESCRGNWIDISEFPPGFYIIKVNDSMMVKFCKE